MTHRFSGIRFQIFKFGDQSCHRLSFQTKKQKINNDFLPYSTYILFFRSLYQMMPSSPLTVRDGYSIFNSSTVSLNKI